MTDKTPTRLRTTGFALVAKGAEVVAAAARRASKDWHEERDELLATVEQLRGGRERVLDAIAAQLDALTRGEQPPPWAEAADDGVVDAAVDVVLKLVGRLQDREAAIVGAFVSLAQRWQTAASEIEHDAKQILQRYSDDEAALRDYYRIAHRAATQARSARTLTVLAGRRPARQFPEPQPLATVVQHAAAQIIDYTRVQVVGNPDIAVINILAEQLIHLIAELLANATRSAPPSTPVVVTFSEVDTGWAISVTDNGHGLTDRLQWAQDRVSGTNRVGLHELGGEMPETGLALVGEYARQHGFLVRLHSTENGGIHAVTTVPKHLLVPVTPHEQLPVTPAPRQPTPTTAPAQPPVQGTRRGTRPPELTFAPPAGGQTPHGLPIRVPREPSTSPRTSARQPAPPPDPGAEEIFMNDFVAGSLPTDEPAKPSGPPATTEIEDHDGVH
jgi:signal transduction histidine kinase